MTGSHFSYTTLPVRVRVLRTTLDEGWREVHCDQGSYLNFANWCGGWMFACVNGVVCVHGEGSSVLSGYSGQAQQHVPNRQFIVKIEIAMRYSGVFGREVGMKCCWVQGC